MEGKRGSSSSFWNLQSERKELILENLKTLGHGESWWADLLSGQELGGGEMETTFPLLVIARDKMLVEGCKLEKHFLPVFAFCNKELPLGVTEEVVMSQAAREQKRFLGVCGSREKMAPGSYVHPIYRSGLKHKEVLFSKALILSTVLEEKAPRLTRSGDWSSEHSWRVK